MAGFGLPALAHHSGAAEFDSSKKIDLTGVVTKVEWTNPHAHFYMDVKDASGKVANWNLELASPNVLDSEWLDKELHQARRHGQRDRGSSQG